MKTEGVMLRSRCRYEKLGEQNFWIFFNLEKRNFMDIVSTKFIDANEIQYNLLFLFSV